MKFFGDSISYVTPRTAKILVKLRTGFPIRRRMGGAFPRQKLKICPSFCENFQDFPPNFLKPHSKYWQKSSFKPHSPSFWQKIAEKHFLSTKNRRKSMNLVFFVYFPPKSHMRHFLRKFSDFLPNF